MNLEPIATKGAPAAIGTYSQAVRAGETLYMSGQIALDPATGVLIEGAVEDEIRRVLDNLDAVLKAAELDFTRVVKFTVYLTSLDDFGAVNGIMKDYLQAPYPARAAVQVSALPRGARVEMDAIAHYS